MARRTNFIERLIAENSARLDVPDEDLLNLARLRIKTMSSGQLCAFYDEIIRSMVRFHAFTTQWAKKQVASGVVENGRRGYWDQVKAISTGVARSRMRYATFWAKF
jgi:hypothetical protein